MRVLQYDTFSVHVNSIHLPAGDLRHVIGV